MYHFYFAILFSCFETNIWFSGLKKLGNELVHVQVHVCAGSCVCMCIYIPRPEVSLGCHSPEVLCLVLRQSLTRT